MARKVTCNAPPFPILFALFPPSHFLSLLVHHPSLNMMLVTAHRILGRSYRRADGWLSGHLSNEEESMMERRDGAAEDACQRRVGLLWGGKATAPKCIVRRREGERFSGLKSILVDKEKVLFILATSDSPLHSFMHPKVPTEEVPTPYVHLRHRSHPSSLLNCPPFVYVEIEWDRLEGYWWSSEKKCSPVTREGWHGSRLLIELACPLALQ